jgi:hypothetical protein
MSGSIINTVRNMFGGVNSAPAQGAQPSGNAPVSSAALFANATPVGAPAAQPAGTTPVNTALPTGDIAGVPAVAPDKSALENYKDLFTVTKTEGNTPTGPQAPVLGFDQSKLTEAVQKMDFMSSVPQEVIAKAQQGDAASLAAMVNHAARSAFQMSANMAAQMTQNALTQQETYFREKVIPEATRQYAVHTTTATQPWAGDPVMQPVADMIGAQLQTKFPTATPAEINQHLSAIMEGMSQRVLSTSGYTVQRGGNSAGNGNMGGGATPDAYDFSSWTR